MFLTGFETLLLCSVIGPIVGVCSIQWEKPLQNLVCQWPSWGQTEERESCFPQVRLLVMIKYVGWENLIALNVIRLYLNKKTV